MCTLLRPFSTGGHVQLASACLSPSPTAFERCCVGCSPASRPRLAGELAIARGFDALCAGLDVRRVAPPEGPSAGPAGLRVLAGWRNGWLLQLGCTRPGCAPCAAPTVQKGPATCMSALCRLRGRRNVYNKCNAGLQLWRFGSCFRMSQSFESMREVRPQTGGRGAVC